jgi:hypothetical protein
MIRYDCLELLAPRITNHLVVTSLSGQKNRMGKPVATSGQLFGWNDGYGARRRHRIGSRSTAPKVIVLESDGSMLLSLFNLPTLANLDPENLKVFVFDNQVYSGTRISEPTATAGKNRPRQNGAGRRYRARGNGR